MITSKSPKDTTMVTPTAESPSLLAVVSSLIRGRTTLAASALFAVAIVIIVNLLLPRQYSATGSLIPEQAKGQGSTISGLAAQFGVALPISTQSIGQTPGFYRDLIESPAILRAVAAGSYVIDGDNVSDAKVLADILGVDGPTPEARLEKVVTQLKQKLVRVTADEQSGIVSVTATTAVPALSQQLTARVLQLVNQFNLQKRQSQAAAERDFIRSRLNVSESALRQAEDSMEVFLDHNRRYESNPQLVFDHDRRQRQIDIQQQMVMGLVQSYEQASINAVRNTPVITVLTTPQVPTAPDSRRLPMKVMSAALLGCLLGLGLVFAREYVREESKRSPGDYETLQEELNSLVGQVRRPFRR